MIYYVMSLNDLLYYLDDFVRLKVPYRWWKKDMPFYEDDMFYTLDGKPPSAQEIIDNDKSVVCSGLINLARRYMGLTIPNIDGVKGTTWTWFRYLIKKEPINTQRTYPIGTLLLRDYSNMKDQGHVAIITSESDNINNQMIVHAIPFYSIDTELRDVGSVVYTRFIDSHYYEDGSEFYTHICLPEYWLK